MKKRKTLTSYLTSPRYTQYINQGYKPIKEYDTYILFEKVVHGKVLYRESFHKFDLYGAEWATLSGKRQDNRGRKKGIPNKKKLETGGTRCS